MDENSDKILIAIPAYCDPELLNTINSALIQADFPDRIHFSICYQDDNLDDYNELKKIKNCKIKWLKKSEAKGCVYARYLCQQMLDDEKYIYQIDSHMRFVKHWDTKIINQLKSLNDKKAILSVYPTHCTEEMMSYPLDDKIYDEPTTGGVMYTRGFREISSYFLKFNVFPIKNNDYRAYKKNAFISGGNLFTYSDAYREVIYDKEMYFYGDELAASIRFFTHGWNVYNPGECYIYHQYERKNRKFPSITNAIKNENKRFMTLLNIDGDSKELGEFGLGTTRTLKEYEKFAGIDFKNKIIYMNAETGEFENEDMINKISYFHQKQKQQCDFINKDELIEVVVIDLFGEYKDCINSCLSKATAPKNIKFLIATIEATPVSDSYCIEHNIKKIIYLNNQKTYTQALSEISKYLENSYMTLIDSSVRFIDGWDKNCCQNIKLCGDKAALTSWIWTATKETNINNFYIYTNIIKEFAGFNNYIPNLRYNESLDLSNRTLPYQTAFISNGFLFCKSDIIKNIPIDPNLTYEEHQYIYSVRLFTNGVNIYYPPHSYMIRTKDELLLHGGVKNLNIICGLMGIDNSYSKTLMSNYEYDLGSIRPLWTFYDYINVNYDPLEMKIVE